MDQMKYTNDNVLQKVRGCVITHPLVIVRSA